ncbi:DUF1415 domain-containing protein [Craterilacuibacter sp.]|uniref:DUF1415 domain-containing protein n=1 Tax=Craterilacuibacter sp. TaxID=2870909 RepID=UPI003F3D1A18
MPHEDIIAATRLWLEQAVIGLDLCPFARKVYLENRVRLVVSDARHLDGFLEDLDSELDRLAATSASEIDTTLLIHPTLFADFIDFNDVLLLADEAISEHGLDGVIQAANFHPDFQFDGCEPDDMVNFVNRAPFATLHLLRDASVEAAIADYPGVDAIAERNSATLYKLGHAGWAALGLPLK